MKSNLSTSSSFWFRIKWFNNCFWNEKGEYITNIKFIYLLDIFNDDCPISQNYKSVKEERKKRSQKL